MIGGFAGTENSVDERDIAANPTILSGDLQGNDTANFGNRSDNSLHVVRVGVSEWGTGELATIDGVIIAGGNADGSEFDLLGGGVLLRDFSVTLSDEARLLLRNSRLTDNSADGAGGGLSAYDSVVEFRDCLIDGNRALGLENAFRLYGGAGFHAAAVRTTRTLLDSNRAFDSGGGGAAIEASEAIELFLGESYFVNTTFVDNRAGDAGGGLAVRSGVVELANCLAAGNHVELDSGSASAAVSAGGGFGFIGGETLIVNSTVADNTAVNSIIDVVDVGAGGGIYRNSSATARIRNCVVWGNSVTREGMSGPEITTSHTAQVNVFPSGTVAASPLGFSNVENYICALCQSPTPDYGNIGNDPSKHDPLFNNPSAGDYRHRSGAMTDTANDADVPDDENDVDDNGITAEVLPVDLVFGPRFLGTAVDMGAYEWCLGDLDLDGMVDGADLGALLNNWGQPGIGDLDGNGIVDGADLGIILFAYGNCSTENESGGSMLLMGGGGFEALHGEYVDELLETWGFETWGEFMAWLETLEGWEVALILEDLF